MEGESPEDGTLAEIYVEQGGKVNVGDKIAFIRGEGEDTPKHEGSEQKKEEEPEPVEQKAKQRQSDTEKPGPEELEQKENAPPQQQGVAEAVPTPRAETTEQKSQAKEQKTEEAHITPSPDARRLDR